MLSRPSAGGASSLLKPFVCTRCLRRAAAARNGASSATAAAAAPPPSTRNNRIRTFATATTAPNAAPAPPPTTTTTTANPTPAAAVAPLPTRRLIALAGPDAPKFLQGLTTNNVAPAQRAGWYTAFLNAQGRVLHDAFVYPSAAANAAAGGAGATTTSDSDDWACFIEVDGGSVDALARVLRRHKLRSKVRMRVVDDGEWAVWSAWLPPTCSPDPDAGLASALDGLRGAGSSGSGVVHLSDERAPGFGHRVLVPGGGGAQLPAPLEGLERVGVREYTGGGGVAVGE
ncbi:Glycine cleavage T-protein [Neofusicoccum parvum]|uniref:Glycine cleavage T-protein n=1 Tax=Neofusicoccum parvum TaxID=310453 RepID=A0ACB5S7G4_9PEZI|nr:Glycine cleavage T-protein [Neofusicoccum parvum]